MLRGKKSLWLVLLLVALFLSILPETDAAWFRKILSSGESNSSEELGPAVNTGEQGSTPTLHPTHQARSEGNNVLQPRMRVLQPDNSGESDDSSATKKTDGRDDNDDEVIEGFTWCKLDPDYCGEPGKSDQGDSHQRQLQPGTAFLATPSRSHPPSTAPGDIERKQGGQGGAGYPASCKETPVTMPSLRPPKLEIRIVEDYNSDWRQSHTSEEEEKGEGEGEKYGTEPRDDRVSVHSNSSSGWDGDVSSSGYVAKEAGANPHEVRQKELADFLLEAKDKVHKGNHAREHRSTPSHEAEEGGGSPSLSPHVRSWGREREGSEHDSPNSDTSSPVDDYLSHQDLVEAMAELMLLGELDEDDPRYTAGSDGLVAPGSTSRECLEHREGTPYMTRSSDEGDGSDTSTVDLDAVRVAVESLDALKCQPSLSMDSAESSSTSDQYAPLIDKLRHARLHDSRDSRDSPSYQSTSNSEESSDAFYSLQAAHSLRLLELWDEPKHPTPLSNSSGGQEPALPPKGGSTSCPLAPQPVYQYPSSLLDFLNESDSSSLDEGARKFEPKYALSFSTVPPAEKSPSSPAYYCGHQDGHLGPGSNLDPSSSVSEAPVAADFSPEFLEILEQQCKTFVEDTGQCDSVDFASEGRKRERASQSPLPQRPTFTVHIQSPQQLSLSDDEQDTDDKVGHHQPEKAVSPPRERSKSPSCTIDEDGLLRNGNGDVIIEIYDEASSDETPPTLDRQEKEPGSGNEDVPAVHAAGSPSSLSTNAQAIIPYSRGLLLGVRAPLLLRGAVGNLVYPPWPPAMRLAYCCLYQHLFLRKSSPPNSAKSPPESATSTNAPSDDDSLDDVD